MSVGPGNTPPHTPAPHAAHIRVVAKDTAEPAPAPESALDRAIRETDPIAQLLGALTAPAAPQDVTPVPAPVASPPPRPSDRDRFMFAALAAVGRTHPEALDALVTPRDPDLLDVTLRFELHDGARWSLDHVVTVHAIRDPDPAARRCAALREAWAVAVESFGGTWRGSTPAAFAALGLGTARNTRTAVLTPDELLSFLDAHLDAAHPAVCQAMDLSAGPAPLRKLARSHGVVGSRAYALWSVRVDRELVVLRDPIEGVLMALPCADFRALFPWVTVAW